jgi:protein-disulfide isomerase/uncharacterized membrane protein
MKTKYYVALLALALGVIAHGYLTLHFYPLHFGLGSGPSACNLSSAFNCDTVSASKFAAIFGIPLAAFGAAFNAILFLIVLLNWLGLRGTSPESQRDPLWLALISVGASIIMGLISLTQLHSYCLFCIAAYVLSVIAFIALWLIQNPSPFQYLKSDILSWLKNQRNVLLWLIATPALAGFIHLSMTQNYGAGDLDKVVQRSVMDWRTQPSTDFSAAPSLTKGASPENSKMTIVEFADFRCGHCQSAAPSLAAFVSAHPEDVRLLFYSFPLDSTCNSAMPQGDGVSCQLAKATYCGERQQVGWQVHNHIFENQQVYARLSDAEAINNQLKGKAAALGLDWTKMESCLNDPETTNAIKAQADQGIKAKVKGTPSIFVNGRLLERGQLIPVLEAVRTSLTQ